MRSTFTALGAAKGKLHRGGVLVGMGVLWWLLREDGRVDFVHWWYPPEKIHRPCQIGIGRLVPFLVPFWNCQLFRVYLPEAKCCGWLNRENQWRSSQASSWCQRFHWLVSMLSAGSTKNQISNLLDDLFFKCRKWRHYRKMNRQTMKLKLQTMKIELLST